MPFIKFAATSETASGTRTTLNFINADHVSRAEFTDHDGVLKLFIGSADDRRGREYVLSGDEAKQALEVLQNL